MHAVIADVKLNLENMFTSPQEINYSKHSYKHHTEK